MTSAAIRIAADASARPLVAFRFDTERRNTHAITTAAEHRPLAHRSNSPSHSANSLRALFLTPEVRLHCGVPVRCTIRTTRQAFPDS